MQRFVISLFMFMVVGLSLSMGQTTVFSDDFSNNQSIEWTTSGTIGSSAWSVNRSGNDWGARRYEGILELTNDASGTANANANGWVFAYVLNSSFSAPYNSTLANNSATVTWTFNMQQCRSDPAGFGLGSYGVAFILAGSSTSPSNSGQGYAVVLGQSGSIDPIRLAKFNNGLSGTLTNIITSNTFDLTDFGTDNLSIKVTFNPTNNTWELFLRKDPSTGFADPESGTLTSQGTATDNSYTSTSLSYTGAYWQGSTAANQTARFDNVKVTVAGAVVCTTPTTQASSVTIASITATSATISFTSGNGSKRIAIARAGNVVTATPADGTTYTASSNFGDGQEIASGQFVVYNDNGSSFSLNGLQSGTAYYVAVFEYNCSPGNELYLTTSPATGSFNTTPSGVSGLRITCTTSNTATIEWNAPVSAYDGVMIAMRQGSNDVHTISGSPSAFTADANFGSGTQFGSTTPYSYVVYKGTGTSVTVTFPSPGAPYKIKAATFAGSQWSTTQPTLTLSSLGVPNINNLVATPFNGAMKISWNNPASNCFDEVIIVVHTASITSSPTTIYTPSSTNYSDPANPTLLNGERVVYCGYQSPQTITGLTNGQTYYFKIFVRKGNEWSSGIETSGVPDNVTYLDYSDLAILGVNTDIGSGDDEIILVMFKDFTPNSTLDFTDNGYERTYAGYWGTTEGVIRLKRKNSTLPAGTIIKVQGQGTTTFNIFVNGANDNANWQVTSINGTYQFNLNESDQVWIMQGGSWNSSAESHKGTYSGKVLYGWTATGWQPSPGYNSTSGSTLFPTAACSMTNVVSLSNKSRVKYSGIVTSATQREWLSRINNSGNWQGFADNSAYNSGGSFGNTLSIIPSSVITNDPWLGDIDSLWTNCRNWYKLKVPDSSSIVTIPGTAYRPLYVKSPGTQCLSLQVENGGNFNVANGGELKVATNLLVDNGGQLQQSGGAIIVGGNIINNGTFNQTNGVLELNGDFSQTIESVHPLSLKKLKLNSAQRATIKPKIAIADTMFLNRGKYTTEDSLILGISVAQPGKLVYQSGFIDGEFHRWFAASPNSGSSTGLFPIGFGDKFRGSRVEFTTAPSGGLISAKYKTTLPSNYFDFDTLTVDGIILNNISTEGYWDIHPSESFVSGTYTISFSANGLTGANNPANIRIIKRNNFSDKAANYNVTWNHGSNGGKGFGPWELTGQSSTSGHFLGSTQYGNFGNINDESNAAFGIYGHSGQWAHASRTLQNWGTLSVLSFQMAVKWRDGSKGVVFYDASNNEIWSFNINHDGYGYPNTPPTWNTYRDDIVLTFKVKQITAGTLRIKVKAKSVNSSWEDTWETTAPGMLHKFRFYNGCNETGGNNERNLFVNNFVLNSPWLSYGTFSLVDGYYTHSGLTSFSEFTLGGNSSENPLPVQILYFTGHRESHNVVLNWGTAVEIDNQKFEIQRSRDLNQWETIGEVSGSGNSQTTRHYRFVDENPLIGYGYYRLKQIDFNGKIEYSEIVSIETTITADWIRIYPNPSNGVLFVAGNQPNTTLIISSILGKICLEKKLDYQYNEINLSEFSEGFYFISLITPCGLITEKVLLSK